MLKRRHSKTIVIALREYAAAVRTKGFVASLILMPVLMLGGIFVQRATQNIADTESRTAVVIDRTPGGTLFGALADAAEKRNKTEIFDKSDPAKQLRPKFELTRLDPAGAPDSPEADAQRYALSERVRAGTLFAFIEIGPDVIRPKIDLTAATRASAAPDSVDAAQDAIKTSLIRYWSNRPTYTTLQSFVQATLVQPVYLQRLAGRGIQLDPGDFIPPAVVGAGLAQKDESGKIVYDKKPDLIVATLLPLGLMMLLLVVVLVGASPLTTNIIEEKQLRIGEVLLGSVSSFELMFGKLLGGVATSLTLGAIYITGTFVTAARLGISQALQPQLIIWFLLFCIVAALMYGALFVAAGAAASNIKEAQALITPVMLLVVTPLFVVGSLLQNPDGPVARVGTFFPLSAPLVTMMRLAMPPGISWWQPAVALVICLATTVVLVWIAGRIFRAGFLLTGKAATPRELLRWVWKG